MPYGSQGRPSSWAAVGVIVLGFLIGGLALVFGPTWWLFWVGAGVVVVGGLLAWVVGVMQDYSEDAH